MREAMLLAAVVFVPAIWGCAMYWVVARLWPARPRAASAARPPAGPPSAHLPDYQI